MAKSKNCIVMIEGYKKNGILYKGNSLYEVGSAKTQIPAALVKELQSGKKPKCREAKPEEIKNWKVSAPVNYADGGPTGHKNTPKIEPEPEPDTEPDKK